MKPESLPQRLEECLEVDVVEVEMFLGLCTIGSESSSYGANH
jgi:hypothetical protein